MKPMVVYSEHVEMITANRRLFLVLLAVALLVYLAWDIEDFDAAWKLGSVLLTHLHVVIGAATGFVLAFSNRMTIELTNETLFLRAGASRQRIHLKEISGARALSEIVLDHPAFSFLSIIGWHTNFVSQIVKTGVRLSPFDGRTVEFSTNNPDHVASMIDQLARQAVTREPLELAGKAGQVHTSTRPQVLPRRGKL